MLGRRHILIAVTLLAAASLPGAEALANDALPPPVVGAPAVPSALAACSPQEGNCVDARFLVRGQSYRASEVIALAPFRDAPAEKVRTYNQSIPPLTAFSISDVVFDVDPPWYLVTIRFGYGWVSSTLLAVAKIEPLDNPRFDCCAGEKARVRESLDKVYRQRNELGKSPSVEQLVALDANIRKILRERPTCWGDTPLDESKGEAIGLSIGHYSGAFEYSGKLLREAHAIDPKSASRSRTLYSTIERVVASSQTPDLPDFRAAKSYLHEFPRGPFAAEASLKLAGAYKDAYLTRHCDHHLDCVADQLDDLKDKSPSEQKIYSKKTAESYLQQSLRLRTPDQHLREWNDGWQECPPSYDFCAD